MSDAPTHDEFVDAEVDRAIAPYRHLLPDADLQLFCEVLRDELLAHPVTARLLQQARPRIVFQSDDIDARTGKPVITPPQRDRGRK